MGTRAILRQQCLIHHSDFGRLFRSERHASIVRKTLLEDPAIVDQLRRRKSPYGDPKTVADILYRYRGGEYKGKKRFGWENSLRLLEAVEEPRNLQEWLSNLLLGAVDWNVNRELIGAAPLKQRDFLTAILETAVDAIGVTLPRLDLIVFWNKGLALVEEVLEGEPYLAFDVSDCVTFHPTPFGKFLEEALDVAIEPKCFLQISINRG